MEKFRNSLLAAAGLSVLLVNLTLLTTRPARSSGPGGPVSVASVYEPALNPVDISLTNGGSYTVPAHKRLVIEFVTANIAVPPNQYFALDLISATPFRPGAPYSQVDHFLTLTYDATYAGSPVYVASEPTRIYVDPGNSVQFVVLGQGTQTDNHYSISGHLVDVP